MTLTAKVPQSSVLVLSGLLREMMKMSRIVEEFQVIDLMVVEHHHLKMVGRDVGVKFWVSVPAEVSGSGNITVDIAKFNSVLSVAASGSEIKLAAKEGKGCLIQAAGAKWRLRLRESLPVDEADMQCDRLGAMPLRPLADQLAFVVSVMPSSTASIAAEHYRTCALFEGKAFGTDGVIAALRVLPKDFGDLSWILSRRAAEFVIRAGRFDDECKFDIVDQGTAVKLCCVSSFTGVFVFTKPGQPLKAEKIVESTKADLDACFVAQKDDLLNMIRLTEPTNSDQTRAVSVRVGDKVLVMVTKDTTGMSQASVDLENLSPKTGATVFSDEKPIVLRANADRLAKSLSMMDSGKTWIGIPPDRRYVLIWDESGNNTLLALMVRLNSG